MSALYLFVLISLILSLMALGIALCALGRGKPKTGGLARRETPPPPPDFMKPEPPKTVTVHEHKVVFSDLQKAVVYVVYEVRSDRGAAIHPKYVGTSDVRADVEKYISDRRYNVKVQRALKAGDDLFLAPGTYEVMTHINDDGFDG